MATKIIITDNIVEKIEFRNEGERCALIKMNKGLFLDVKAYSVIILNKREREQLKELL